MVEPQANPAERNTVLCFIPPPPHSEEYKVHFPNRNLQAYSTLPLLVQPCHYAGDPGWVSDTETSTIWDDDSVRTDWRGSFKTLKGSAPPAALRSASHDEL